MRLVVRLILLSCVFFFVFSNVWASDKKGVGLYINGSSEQIATLSVNWYYTWTPTPIEGVPLEKFVPMLRSYGGRGLKNQIAYFRAQGIVPVLLALNEPDRSKHDNMSVELVIRTWPEISSLSKQISAPATTGPFTAWFDKFYRQAEKQGLKCDFMAIHLYSDPDVDKFLEML